MKIGTITERRRGWCPGVRRPMATGDGLLVRVHPLGGRLTAAHAHLIAQAARQHGNGLLDITARGNLQIRGVRNETFPALLWRLDEMGLVEPEREGPNRLTLVSPLAGIDPGEHFDALALADEIELQSGAIEGLPAKFFVSVDGGGIMPLEETGADLHVFASGEAGSRAVCFGLGSLNGVLPVGATSLACAPEAAGSIISGFAEMRRSGQTEARRIRELHPECVRQLIDRASLDLPPPPLERKAAPRAGAFDLAGSHAVLLALPFGRCSASQLEAAAEWSERCGTGEVRLSFTRAILLPGIAKPDVTMLLDRAGQHGFVTAAGNPLLTLLACPGRPACASASTPAPDDAVRLAGACADLLATGASLHVSGCPKGCAHPGKADLSLIGRTDGTYDVVVDGSTRDLAFIHLSIEEIMKRLSPLKTRDDLRCALQEAIR